MSSLVLERWRRKHCKCAWRSCFSLQSNFYPFSLQAKQQSLALLFPWPLLKGLLCCHSIFTMGTKMKGIYKSFKYISQIFVVKEREMEIGYPTDVKHVAHIGWDGQSGTAPSWMNEFKTAPDFSTSIGNSIDSSNMALSTWSSQDFEQSMGGQPASDMFKDIPSTDLPNIPKKQKRKKKSSTSSPKSASVRSSRTAKSKTTYNEMETTNLQV